MHTMAVLSPGPPGRRCAWRRPPVRKQQHLISAGGERKGGETFTKGAESELDKLKQEAERLGAIFFMDGHAAALTITELYTDKEYYTTSDAPSHHDNSGVKSIGIGENKMDCDPAEYERARYDEVANERGDMLVKVGWGRQSIEEHGLLPISGWRGDDGVTKPENMVGWKGQEAEHDGIDKLCLVPGCPNIVKEHNLGNNLFS